jgi:hypothetical protein
MKYFTLFYFIIFIIALLIGYTISTQFAPQGLDSLSPSLGITFTSGDFMKTMANGQRSILLIGTSDMNATHPRLVSAWLVTYFPSDTIVRLLSIIPSSKQGVSDLESQLSQSFSIEKNKGTFTLGQEFISVLEEHNYWWSGYIIYDEQALVKTIDAMGGIFLQGKTMLGEQVLVEYHTALSHPTKAYQINMSVLQSACRRISALSGNLNLSQLVALYPDHFSTDLDLSQIQADWKGLSNSKQVPTCRFPMQEISLQIP